MDQELFSTTLVPFTDVIENPALQDSLSYLSENISGVIRILKWSEDRIAIPLNISVEVPTLGTQNEIDIKDSFGIRY
jgi:hypothetical protein